MKYPALFLLAVMVLVSPLLAGPGAAEQHPDLRQSWYIGGGVGWGSADGDFTVIGDIKRQNGITGFFRFGRALNDRWSFGLESAVWEETFEDQNIKWTLATIALSATYFVPKVGLYGRAGIGLGSSFFEQSQAIGGRVVQDTAGLEFMGAIGYEYRLLPKLALGPQIDFVYIEMDSDITLKANFFTVSAQVTWYW